VIPYSRYGKYAAMAIFLAVAMVACHKQEQAVVGVAKTAVDAEHKAQANARANASELENQRAQMERIPLPTKSLYINVRDVAAWANPFLTVNADSLTLSYFPTDTPPTTGTKAAKQAATRRREVQLHPDDLAETLVALSPEAWRYGRVIAVAESATAKPKERPNVRRNVETAMQKLSDLGIVVNEWPVR
jgi:hypothetical protein